MGIYSHDESTNADGLTFDVWLSAVDHLLLSVVYVTHDCLGNWDVRRGWRENLPPAEAAVQLLEHDDSSILVPELEAELWAAAQ
jgi:hypothetical protein